MLAFCDLNLDPLTTDNADGGVLQTILITIDIHCEHDLVNTVLLYSTVMSQVHIYTEVHRKTK